MPDTTWEPKEAVARGAALLDQHEPDWWQKIDFARLRLADCEACVLGQLFCDQFFSLPQESRANQSPFGYGLVALRLNGSFSASWEYGFDIPHGKQGLRQWQIRELWHELEEAWLHEVKERANA